MNNMNTCRWCNNWKNGVCTKITNEYISNTDYLDEFLIDSVDDIIDTQLHNLQYDIDKIIDKYNMKEKDILDIGKLFNKYINSIKENTTETIKDEVGHYLPKVRSQTVLNTYNIDESEFYCSFWR